MGGNINGGRRGHVNVKPSVKRREKHNLCKRSIWNGARMPANDRAENARTMLMMGTKVRMMIHPEEEIPEYQPAKAKEDETFWEA
jgi:hypothetical protein